jgi:hypothetical protein
VPAAFEEDTNFNVEPPTYLARAVATVMCVYIVSLCVCLCVCVCHHRRILSIL